MLLLLPPVSALLARPMDRLDGFAMSEKPKSIAVLLSLLLLAASGIIFWAFRTATHFLGDGFLWANHLMQDRFYNEPVSSWLFKGIYRGLNAVRIFGEVNPVKSCAVTSVLAGLVFIFFAHKTAKLLSLKRGDYILLIVAIMSCGMIMLFFGYVETYPPLAASVLAFLYYSLKWFRRGGSITTAVLAFIVTVILHPSALALLPGFLVLMHYRAGKTIDKKQLLIVLAVVIVAGFITLWVFRETRVFSGKFRKHFLPLFLEPAKQNVGYPIFSLRGLFDYINELLLIVPLIALLPALFISRKRRSAAAAEPSAPLDGTDGTRERIFLAVSGLFYFLVFAVFNEDIGTSRDWDIFSPLALPLLLWVFLLLRDRFPGKGSVLAALTLAIVVTHTAPWIALNADLVKSEERFIELVDSGFWNKRAKGYGYSTVAQYYRHYGKTLPAIQFMGKAAAIDPKNVKFNYYIGEMYSGLGKHGAALEHYFKVLEYQGDHFEALNNAGVSYLELGRPRDAEPYLKRALEIDPTSISTMQNLGFIYLATGRARDAVGIYLSAVELEPANAILHISLAKAFFEFGDPDSARRHIEAARSIDPAAVERLEEGARKKTPGTPADETID